MNKSVFGLQENLAAALAYFFGFVSGIVVLVLERENKFVRFSALQSTIFFLVMFLLSSVLGLISDVLPSLLSWPFGIARWALGIVSFVAWAFLVFKALSGQTFKIPILGDICWEQVNK